MHNSEHATGKIAEVLHALLALLRPGLHRHAASHLLRVSKADESPAGSLECQSESIHLTRRLQGEKQKGV